MKYLIVLAVLAVAFWIWRSNRVSDQNAHPPKVKPGKAADSQSAETMLQCAYCAVHLPASDAVAGKQGRYCSVEHLRQLEG